MVKESEKIFNFMDLDFQDITRKFIYNATHPKTNEELPHNVHIRQNYEIKSPPWTILWFRILGIFSVENIKRLCVFMFQT